MFWKKKPKKQPSKAKNDPKKGQKQGQKLSREEIIAQAKANAAAAREEIGDETLEKIKQAMLKKEQSTFEQAKKRVKSMDDDKVRDNLRFWLRED